MSDITLFDYQAPADLLQDRIIAITGAGSGIGRAVALDCARHGATVILIGRDVSKLESIYDDIESANGPQAAILPFDLETTAEQPYLELANAIDEAFGRLSGLLHNAGILGAMAPLQHYPIDTWNRVMQTNLNARFTLTRYLLPLLQQEQEDASVIFTASSVGRDIRAYWGAYAISKYATEGLMQLLHEELHTTSQVRVNTVNPGGTATAMRKQAFPGEDPQTLPTPQDITGIYLYLLGRDSIGVSGQQLSARSAS